VIVGILSDTHDRADATMLGVAALRGAGAAFLIHCGDVGSEHVLDHLAGVPSAFVFGNNDWDKRGLQRYAEQLDVRCLGDAGELELGGKAFYVCHGDDFRAMRRALDEQRFDYLLHGHTHARRDERVGRTRIINPGALYRAREKTVAVLDTETDRLTFLPVKA
jgi:putative phosphoesterase